MANEEGSSYQFPIEWKSRKFLFTVLFVIIFVFDHWFFHSLEATELAILGAVLGVYNLSEGFVDGMKRLNE